MMCVRVCVCVCVYNIEYLVIHSLADVVVEKTVKEDERRVVATRHDKHITVGNV